MNEPEEQPLTDDDLEVLARMKRQIADAMEQPDWNSVPITHPDKYGGAIGADADGNIPTYSRTDKMPPRAELPVSDEPDEDSPTRPHE
jgi:hypothetical protein